MVIKSIKAWVGWDIDPSPPLIKTISGIYSSNSRITESGCLRTQRSTPIKPSASTVSYIDSPFSIEELEASKPTTLHPRFFAAISNDDLVLVLGSQKIFATVLSGKRVSFLKEPSSFLKFLANSIRSSISCLDKSFIDSRLLFI